MRDQRIAGICVAGSLVLSVLTLWLLVHNLTVDISASDYNDEGPAGTVGCVVAPYDAGLWGNDEPPGGEHAVAYSEEVASDCYSANMQRFKVAAGTGSAALLLLLAGVWLFLRSKADARAPA